MVVNPEQPSDPGDRDASVAKLKSLRRHSLIDRRHNRGPKLNNQRQGGRGSRPLRSRPRAVVALAGIPDDVRGHPTQQAKAGDGPHRTVRRRTRERGWTCKAKERQNRRTMTMGEIRVNVTLENTGDREVAARGLGVEGDVRRTTVEGVVDTGAVDLVIPEEIAQELGLRHHRTRTVIYADERREERPMTNVTIEIRNLATEVPAIVGVAGSQVLIGQVVLELLDLIADCKNRTLTPRHPEGPVLAVR